MDVAKIKEIRQLLDDFPDLGLNEFREQLATMTETPNYYVDRFLVEQLTDFGGNRAMRSAIASVLAGRDDESMLEAFASVIEKETDVSLCRECIRGLTRIETREAAEKLEFLARNKPNPTISALLQEEIQKRGKQEPLSYHVNQLKQGQANHRACSNAARALIRLGDPAALPLVLDSFDQFDEFARIEAAQVISQLGDASHLDFVHDLIRSSLNMMKRTSTFFRNLTNLNDIEKVERVDALKAWAKDALPENQGEDYEAFLGFLDSDAHAQAENLIRQVKDKPSQEDLGFYMESIFLIIKNQSAHAKKCYDAAFRQARTKLTRLRQLISKLAYGMGRITGIHDVSPQQRDRTVVLCGELLGSNQDEIAKLALYGSSYFIRSEDEKLLDACVQSRQVEGLSRLIDTLGEKQDPRFIDFFLKLAESHQIADVQDMAMHALARIKDFRTRLKKLLQSEDQKQRIMAIRIAGEMQAKEFISILSDMLQGTSDHIRVHVLRALGRIGDPETLEAIEHTIRDAKSTSLINTGIDALASINSPEAFAALQHHAATSRVQSVRMLAVERLIQAFDDWRRPLPEEMHPMILENLEKWMEDHQQETRARAYEMGGRIVTWRLKTYQAFREIYQNAISAIRKKSTWQKEELAQAEDGLRRLNRNYYFLKEILGFYETLKSKTRGYDSERSVDRMAAFEGAVKLLENSDFPLDDATQEHLVAVVKRGLELGSQSWREMDLLFRIAGHAHHPKLQEVLGAHLKTVPPQAKSSLLDALTQQGMGLGEISDMMRIRKILVLDGSSFFRKRIASFLKKQDYEVRDTDNLTSAMEMLAKERPDLIISELIVKTPYDGADFLEDAARQFGSAVQLLVSTNTRDQSVIARIKALKPKWVLHKPYSFDELESVINS